MITQRAKIILAIAVMLAQPLQADKDNLSPLKVAGIIGGAVALGCGIVAGIDYLSTPSDQRLIEKAESAEEYAQNQYGSITSYLYSQHYAAKNDVLRTIAHNHIHESVHAYVRGMKDALHNVSKARRNLSDRMHRLDRKGERYNHDYRIMEEYESSLAQLETSLRKSSDYLEQHSGYFNLSARFDELDRYYADVLTIVDRYGHNRVSLAQYMREHIALSGSLSRDTYPTISYVETLNDKIRALEQAIKACKVSGDLVTQASSLQSKLSQIRSVLLADDRYVYEVQERERARREEERMRLERERIAAEQRRAEAAQRQAYAAECQNREMARQNDLLREQIREQNRIDRDCYYRHRHCSYRSCCCDQVDTCPVIKVEFMY